jgi:hypothetical protein
MEGTINGTLTVRKGSERCELAGIMEEGVPLGQAYAHMQQSVPAAVHGYGTQTAAPPRPQIAQQTQQDQQTAQSAQPAQSRSLWRWAWPIPAAPSGSAWPAPTAGLSD